MIAKPLVSIGMPVYNGERYIRRALDSLLAQDYRNFELIISDNASTDETLQICEEYALRENRIRIHMQPYNVGILRNFQSVLELAQGEYFMWAAVDDYWLPGFVSTLARELNKSPDYGVAMCAVELTNENGTSLGTIRFSGKANPNSKSYLEMALCLDTPLKYNFFIYGIFRAKLIKSAVPIPAIVCGDRRFLCQFALATRFRYIDSALYIRMINDKRLEDRYPNDEYGRKHIIFKNEKQWFYFEPVLIVYRILYRSKIVPQQRKIFIPIILSCLFYKILMDGIRGMAKNFIVRFFPYSLQKKLLRSVRERDGVQSAKKC